jgi:hypothetical protein
VGARQGEGWTDCRPRLTDANPRAHAIFILPPSRPPAFPTWLRIQDEVVAAGAKAQYSGVFQTILKVAKDEGVLKLWRGVSYFPLSPPHANPRRHLWLRCAVSDAFPCTPRYPPPTHVHTHTQVTPVLIGSTPECALEIGGNSVARQMVCVSGCSCACVRACLVQDGGLRSGCRRVGMR